MILCLVDVLVGGFVFCVAVGCAVDKLDGEDYWVEGCVSGGLVNDAMSLEEFFECGVDKLCPIVTSYGFDICFEVILNITMKGLDMGDCVVFTGHEVSPCGS
ncbi:hypothetical protein Tco_0528460 [Tanacetum coccineum]